MDFWIEKERCVCYEHLFQAQEGTEANVIGFRDVNRAMYQSMEAISVQEFKEAVRALKNGKAADLDEVTSEMIKKGGD